MKHQEEADFLSLVDEYQKIVHNVCHVYTDNPADHEDLFQEMLVQLWKGYQRFKGDAKISTWIYRVCLYTAITYIKKVMRNRKALDAIEFQEYQHPKSQETDEELLVLAMKKLDATDRAFILLYLEDKSYNEMSQILGITESNVGVKLNRIKKKLRAIMN